MAYKLSYGEKMVRLQVDSTPEQTFHKGELNMRQNNGGAVTFYSTFTGATVAGTAQTLYSNVTNEVGVAFGTYNALRDYFDANFRKALFGGSVTSTPETSALIEYSDNDDAINRGGLSIGSHYRTGDAVKIVHN